MQHLELVRRSEALLSVRDDVAEADLGQSSGEEGLRDRAEDSEHEALSDTSADSFEDEDEEPSTDEDFSRVRDFLITSKAYASLKDHLLVFVHKPDLRRIAKAIGNTAIRGSGKELHHNAPETVVKEIS
jgi:hypothetical protein